MNLPTTAQTLLHSLPRHYHTLSAGAHFIHSMKELSTTHAITLRLDESTLLPPAYSNTATTKWRRDKLAAGPRASVHSAMRANACLDSPYSKLFAFPWHRLVSRVTTFSRAVNCTAPRFKNGSHGVEGGRCCVPFLFTLSLKRLIVKGADLW